MPGLHTRSSIVVVGTSLTSPSVGFTVEAWERVDALCIVVDVAPIAAVRHAVTFTLSFRTRVPIALAPLQLAWVYDYDYGPIQL